jgi:prepilin-type N-terminal cleavage/methylation domain-containing protein
MLSRFRQRASLAARNRSDSDTNENRAQAGFTLVELLVAMVILSIVMGMTTLAVRTVAQTYVSLTGNTDSLRLNARATNRITKTVRGGTEIKVLNGVNLPAFEQAGPTDLSLYVSQPTPRKVSFTLTDDELVEETTNATAETGPYWQFPANPDQSVLIASKIPPESPRPLFRYYDSLDQEVDVSSSADQTDPEVLSRIVAVQLTLTVQTSANTPPTEISNRVELPNLGVVKQ